MKGVRWFRAEGRPAFTLTVATRYSTKKKTSRLNVLTF